MGISELLVQILIHLLVPVVAQKDKEELPIGHHIMLHCTKN
jgi:hypothetical protein